MGKPRPSALPNLAECPRWVGRPNAGAGEQKDAIEEAADQGTRMHEFMERVVACPVETWNDVAAGELGYDPELHALACECMDQVRDLFTMGMPVTSKATLGLKPDAHYTFADKLWKSNVDPFFQQPCFGIGEDPPDPGKVKDGIYLEIGLDPGVCKPGTADLVAVTGKTAVLVDYKSNRVVRSHHAQQLAYVVGLFRALPNVDTVEQRIVAPRLKDVHAPEVFRRADVPKYEAELQAIVDKATDAFEPGVPGSVCSMCAGNGRCPWQALSVSLVEPGKETPNEMMSNLGALPAVPPMRVILDPRGAEERGARRDLVDWLAAMCEAVKKDDAQWVQLANGEIAGRKATVCAGRYKFDETKRIAAIDKIRSTFGWDSDTMYQFLSVDVPSFVETLRMKEGLSKTLAAETAEKMLAEFRVRGASYVVLRKAKAGPKQIQE